MFPTPIEKSSAADSIGYKLILPVALFIWLLPLLAIFHDIDSPGSRHQRR